MQLFTQLGFLALAAAPTVSAGGSWSFWFNGEDKCGGQSYDVTGSGSQGCAVIDRSHFAFLGLSSVLVDTQISSGYCKLSLYQDDTCGKLNYEYTAYSTDSSGGSPGSGHYCWNDIRLGASSWNVYCTP
ncbi:hypothetical protein F4803DRAFT_201336 [Xylaria telfairii]|nr:hypothetical protein F4803DRAFT_201336 [Xylaria telfairii]